MADLQLLPYQLRWTDDRAQVKVYEKSRRIGVTWAEAYDCALNAAETAGGDSWYIGYNKEMALEFVEAAARWARQMSRAAATIEETVIADEVRDILAYRIRFASGHKVVALSSRPSNLRGKEGSVVIDEAAFHERLGELLKAALAFTMWGGGVHVISTHNGADNPFNELVIDIRAGRVPYSLHRTTLDDALAEGLYRTICGTQGKEWSAELETAWRRELIEYYRDDADEELFCIPRSSAGAYLPSSLVESRMRDDVPVLRWEPPENFLSLSEEQRRRDAQDWCEENLKALLARLDAGLMTAFGEDFGRSGDITVIWPLQLDQALRRRTPFLIELRNVPFRQQEQILFYTVDRLPRFVAGAMDARGNGQYLAEQAALRYGSRVEQVMLSPEWYRENMPRYKAAFEDGLIDLPRDADILSDHRALRVEHGIAKIPERRTAGADRKQRHGDSAIAGALAYYASQLNPVVYEYTPAPRRRFFDAAPSSRRPDDDEDDGLGPRAMRHRAWRSF